MVGYTMVKTFPNRFNNRPSVAPYWGFVSSTNVSQGATPCVYNVGPYSSLVEHNTNYLKLPGSIPCGSTLSTQSFNNINLYSI